MPRTCLPLKPRNVGAKLLDATHEWTPFFQILSPLFAFNGDTRFEPLLLAPQVGNVDTRMLRSERCLALFQLLLVLLFIGVSSLEFAVNLFSLLDSGRQLALLGRNLGSNVVHSRRALLDALLAGLACFRTGADAIAQSKSAKQTGQETWILCCLGVASNRSVQPQSAKQTGQETCTIPSFVKGKNKKGAKKATRTQTLKKKGGGGR